MGHGYTEIERTRYRKKWRKRHNDGFVTEVEAERDEETGRWTLRAEMLDDEGYPYKKLWLGETEDEEEVERVAYEWMEMRPYGVEDQEADVVHDNGNSRSQLDNFDAAADQFFGN